MIRLCALASIVCALVSNYSEAQTTHPISFGVVKNDSSQPNGGSISAKLSADGSYVVFESAATNLVANVDLNNTSDIFLMNRATGQFELISITASNTAGNNNSSDPDISADGRYVVFESDATDLVTTDLNNTRDIFVRDRETDTTYKVSTARDGSASNGYSYSARITRNGRFVTFISQATNLLAPAVDTNNTTDIFLQDLNVLTTGAFTGIFRTSVADQTGAEADTGAADGRPAIAANGDLLVFFESLSENLVPGDTNNVGDVFVRNLTTGRTERVSVADDGTQITESSTYSSMTPDGKYVVLQTRASNLVSGDTNRLRDCFVKDRETGAIIRASVGPNGIQSNGDCGDSAISDDGNIVVFESEATSMFPDNFKDADETDDIYLRDRVNGVTLQLSLTPTGGPTFDESRDPTITSDATTVMFASNSKDIVSSDNNNASDIFKVVDECLDNPAKLAPGICGCDTLDTDTDKDGTVDCQDLCPNDPNGDANNNGAEDCLDPDGNTVPTAPRIAVKGRTATVTMQQFPGRGISYRPTLVGRTVSAKRSSARKVVFRDLAPGSYTVRYTVTFRGKISQPSAKRRFTIR